MAFDGGHPFGNVLCDGQFSEAGPGSEVAVVDFTEGSGSDWAEGADVKEGGEVESCGVVEDEYVGY